MSHELKIIIGKTNAETKIFVDEEQIGFIQEIKVTVSTLKKYQVPDVTIVFPDLTPYQQTNGESLEKINKSIEILRKMPQVTILMVKI